MYQPTWQDVALQDYPNKYQYANRQIEKINKTETWNSLPCSEIGEEWVRRSFSYQFLFLSLEIDLSSVSPHFEIKNETSLIEKTIPAHIISEEDILAGMIEHNFIVRMPPKKVYPIKLEVKNIRRGKPKIV